jgi:cell division septal protein FtsQ
MRKPKLNLPLKTIAIILVIFLALISVIGYIWRVLETSDYFTVKDIISKEGDTSRLSYLKGKNMFSIDLKNEAGYISQYYPNIKSVKLTRLLPDRIFADFIKRKPVAFVKLYRYFSVDQDGVIFYTPEEGQDLDLPVISGLETKIFGPKPGKRYNTRELAFALNIISEFRGNRALRNYRLKKIDVGNSTNASILIERESENLEVRLGPENIKDKLAILAALVIQAKNDLAKIKYIDLRFKEPVIKFK